MDFGLTSGNFIIIPTPPGVKWEEEDEIYGYLLFNDEARKNLLQQIDEKRFSSWTDIWVHHEVLLFPFLVEAKTTDMGLQQTLIKRLFPFLEESEPGSPFAVTVSLSWAIAHVSPPLEKDTV